MTTSASYDRSSTTRFPAPVDSALRTAGWEPGRWDIKQAEYWADASGTTPPPPDTGTPSSPPPSRLGRIRRPHRHRPRTGRQIAPTPVRIDPLTGLHLARTFADLGRALSTQLCPLGVEPTATPTWRSTARAGSTASTTPATGTSATPSTKPSPSSSPASNPPA